MTWFSINDGPSRADQQVYDWGQELVKAAADASPEPAYDMSGMLYMAPSGYGLLSVPNALVRGVFSSLNDNGLELPPGPGGRLNAHITVFKPDEIKTLGGPDGLTERGKHFNYRVGGLVSVAPAGWTEMSKVWMLRVHSPELQELRRSYGLSSLPSNGKFDFHITVAVRRKGVLGRNDASKTLATAARPTYQEAAQQTN